MEEENVESLFTLLTTIGQSLDKYKPKLYLANGRNYLKVLYFIQYKLDDIGTLPDCFTVSSESKFPVGLEHN